MSRIDVAYRRDRQQQGVYFAMYSTMLPCVCVSEMDGVWPACINSLPDWLRLSGNATGEPEQDLIAIRALARSSRGQKDCDSATLPANIHLRVNTEQVNSSAESD